uniref:Uncharacterized protein n=1 Tax=Solanum lycopersicum TaxID=4081 RepID=A0A3Q7J896_SOLLC
MPTPANKTIVQPHSPFSPLLAATSSFCEELQAPMNRREQDENNKSLSPFPFLLDF